VAARKLFVHGRKIKTRTKRLPCSIKREQGLETGGGVDRKLGSDRVDIKDRTYQSTVGKVPLYIGLGKGTLQTNKKKHKTTRKTKNKTQNKNNNNIFS